MHEDLKALKPFTYAGRALQVGDTFSATRSDSRALRAVRRADYADAYQSTEASADVTKGAPAAKTAARKTPAKKAGSK